MAEVIRLDREGQDRAWMLGRFHEMAQDIVTTWHIAQDIVANWTEGHNLSALPECEGKYPSQVFGEWIEASAASGTAVDRPGKRLVFKMLKAARVKRLAPTRYDNLPWATYDELPAHYDAHQIADVFARAEAQPLGVSKPGLRLVLGNATGMKPPYWNQVIDALMYGEHDLTPAMARNIIATATQWLKENPDAPTRR